jgi:hypothetical protein
MSSLGQISADGLQDSYDMYFFDESHSIGIGSPQELLQFDILAVAEGICNMQAVADSTDGNHVSDGTVTGFVLFSGDDHLSVYEDPDRVVAGITTGACCLDASCSEQTPADCFDFGGSYLGDNVICDAGSCAPPCPSDINGDGVVSVADLLILIADWGPSSGDSDLDGDGDVDVADLLLLIAAWGDC